MNWLDVTIGLVLAAAAFGGLRRGFVKETIDLLGVILALAVSLHFYASLADTLVLNYHVPVLLAKPFAFAALWFGVEIVAGFVLGFISRMIPKILRESFLNRLVGIIPAVAKAVVTVGVLLAILAAVPLPSFQSTIAGSRLAGLILSETSGITHWLERSVGANFAQTFNLLTVPNEGSEKPQAIPKVTDPAKLRVESGLEQQMLVLVNQVRAQAGAPPLVMDDNLQKVARAHSRDMWLRGYFGHVDPDGNDPFARMRAAGITFETAGENIALAPTLSIAQFGLMNSPPHRANILDPHFGRVGIGIVSAGASGLMVTQDFRN